MVGRKRIGLAALALLAAWPAGAAPITFDFTASGGVVSGSGHGLTRRYTTGGVTLTVSGFSLAAPGGSFTQASVGQYGGAGLGVCNASEGLNCSAHQIDNASGFDMVLLRFDQAMAIDQALARTHSNADTDVAYYLGNVSTSASLAGASLAGLAGYGFGAQALDLGSSGRNASNTVTFGGGTHNALLLGAHLGETNDAFKLRSITVDFTAAPTIPDVAVPAPGALVLFATGMLGLVLLAGRWRAQRPSASSTIPSVSS